MATTALSTFGLPGIPRTFTAKTPLPTDSPDCYLALSGNVDEFLAVQGAIDEDIALTGLVNDSVTARTAAIDDTTNFTGAIDEDGENLTSEIKDTLPLAGEVCNCED